MSDGFVVGRFLVEAVSRFPKIGRDYSSGTHRYLDSYLNPDSYGIQVDVFPGKVLVQPRGDQQLPPGEETRHQDVEDIWALRCPRNLVGWEYSISGTMEGERYDHLPAPLRKFEGKGRGVLPANHEGSFDETRKDNAWNWLFTVPALGTYTVTIAELLTTPAGDVDAGPSRSVTLHLRDFLVVSIGDSAASGQGNPDIPGKPAGFDVDIEWWEYFIPPALHYELTKAAYDYARNQLKLNFVTAAAHWDASVDMDPDPVWLEPKADRSLRSGHALGAKRLEELDKGIMITFLPFARTDSRIQSGLTGPRDNDGWIGGDGQIAEVARTIGNRRIDALLVSIGINDIGVTSSLTDLEAGDNKLWSSFASTDDADARAKVEQRDRDNIDRLPVSFDVLEAALELLNVRDVYLTEYPEALFDNRNGDAVGGCELFSSDFDMDITATDARLLKSIAHDLNAKIKAEVDKRRAKGMAWYYIDGIADGFAGHGYCVGKPEPNGRYFVQASESLALQGNVHGACHPNEFGAKIIAACVKASVQRNTLNPLIAGQQRAPIERGVGH